MLLNELEEFFRTTRVSLDDDDTIERLKAQLRHTCFSVEKVIHELQQFCRTEPRLPRFEEKETVQSMPIDLNGVTSAAQARERIEALRGQNATCDLAFSAFRDFAAAPWKPFIKAALERNPVIIEGLKDHSLDAAYALIEKLPNESIYDEPTRIAQPDEVWNYQRGDGLEKAICMANVVRAREPDAMLRLERSAGGVKLVIGKNRAFDFASSKTVGLPEEKDF